ncbi:MAG: ATP-binding protein, partial [Desulfovibrionaceae bacterium]|nr:ATP-binding protein [Desulfovibrionaceae bacterium]
MGGKGFSIWSVRLLMPLIILAALAPALGAALSLSLEQRARAEDTARENALCLLRLAADDLRRHPAVADLIPEQAAAPAWLSGLIKVLPESTTLAVCDAEGRIVFEAPGRPRPDHPAPGPPQADIQDLGGRSPDEAWIRDDESEGARLYVFKRLAPARGRVLFLRLGIDKDSYLAPVDRALVLSLAGIGLAGLIILAIAVLGTDRLILRPAAVLTSAARRIEQGDFEARTGLRHGPDEFGRLARIFDSMASTLENQKAQSDHQLAEIKEREGRIQVLFNATPDSVILTDAQGVVLAMNEQAAKRRARPARELIGRCVFDLLPEEAAGPRRRRYAEVLANRRPMRFLEERREGIFQVGLFPVTDQDGRVSQLASFSHDITESQRIKRQLVAATRAAEDANEAKTQLLANMSHELRTPLNGILGMTQLLMDTGPNREQREYLDLCRRSSDHLLEIVNNLLELANLETGGVKIVEKRFSVRACLESLFQAFSVRSRLKGLNLALDVDQNVPESIVADEFRLRQILTHIVGNAVRHTESGSINLRVEVMDAPGDFRPLSSPSGGFLIFSIRDTGIGIPKDKQDMVMEDFGLAENYLTKRYSGSGLGLPISKRAVEMLGGSLWLESDQGRGSTFSFSIPFNLPEGPAPGRPWPAAAPEPAPALPDRPLDILLAEDEVVNRSLT